MQLGWKFASKDWAVGNHQLVSTCSKVGSVCSGAGNTAALSMTRLASVRTSTNQTDEVLVSNDDQLEVGLHPSALERWSGSWR